MRRSGPLWEVSYVSFREAEIICPVNTLKVYLQHTKKFLSAAEDGLNPLFIAIREPHKLVTSATISRWMKNLMEQSGIDVDQFKPHSVRAAATSAASTLGVSIKDILKTANWARESTFLRFYHKPIIKFCQGFFLSFRFPGLTQDCLDRSPWFECKYTLFCSVHVCGTLVLCY